ncbi:hypothetical protein MSG28_006014 [Choristoneura fumiferana]|uniref:Uncharacterized protein n=1 Tax=Choristoneura fumiferana TaxID=7141 RepID=A0ACC0L1R9_CHOFU|nr:hypothetical protein MSG28_006014 [Choristoneura fumiferana]
METVQIIQLLLIAVGLFAISVGCWQCWKIKNTRRNRAVEVNIHIVPTGALQPPGYTESNNTHMQSQSPACDMSTNNVNKDGTNDTGTKFDKGDAIGKKYKMDGGNNGKDNNACNISDDSGLKSSGEDCDATSKNRDDNHAESNSGVKFKSHNDTVEKLDGGSTDYEGFLKFNFN